MKIILLKQTVEYAHELGINIDTRGSKLKVAESGIFYYLFEL